jgi:hypothetical protein
MGDTIKPVDNGEYRIQKRIPHKSLLSAALRARGHILPDAKDGTGKSF